MNKFCTTKFLRLNLVFLNLVCLNFLNFVKVEFQFPLQLFKRTTLSLQNLFKQNLIRI